MEISSKHNFYLNFHIFKKTDFPSYFFKMENEIPKTPEVKNAGVERNKIVDNRVYSFEKLDCQVWRAKVPFNANYKK